MQEIIKQINLSAEHMNINGPNGVSIFDKSLLQIEPKFFEEKMLDYFLEKAHEVQIGTSKRVIKKFHKVI